MSTARTIYLYGDQTDPTGANAIVQAVRAGGIDAALVSTWDGVRTDDAAADDLAGTRRGWLARHDTEVRWRREGTRVLVTVVAESPVDGLQMEPLDVAEVHAGPLTHSRWEPTDLQLAPRRLTYLDKHGAVLAARDQPTRTDREA